MWCRRCHRPLYRRLLSGRSSPLTTHHPAMAQQTFLAVDLGASSGRVVAGLFDGSRLKLEEIHRFENGPIAVGRHLHWDLLALWKELQNGLRAAAAKYPRQIVSIGVDTWGVDFALLGRGDVLLANPHHYRDNRTDGMME